MTEWLREGVVGGIGIALGLSAEGVGLGVEDKGGGCGGAVDVAALNFDELPNLAFVE